MASRPHTERPSGQRRGAGRGGARGTRREACDTRRTRGWAGERERATGPLRRAGAGQAGRPDTRIERRPREGAPPAMGLSRGSRSVDEPSGRQSPDPSRDVSREPGRATETTVRNGKRDTGTSGRRNHDAKPGDGTRLRRSRGTRSQDQPRVGCREGTHRPRRTARRRERPTTMLGHGPDARETRRNEARATKPVAVTDGAGGRKPARHRRLKQRAPKRSAPSGPSSASARRGNSESRARPAEHACGRGLQAGLAARTGATLILLMTCLGAPSPSWAQEGVQAEEIWTSSLTVAKHGQSSTSPFYNRFGSSSTVSTEVQKPISSKIMNL